MLALIIVVGLLTELTLSIFPDLLTTKIAEGVTNTMGKGYLERGIEYLFNVVLVIILYKDMKKENIYAIPVLVLTFFSNLVGILFFFLIITSKTLNYKKLIYNE